MADDSPPERSAADKERSRQQSRPVNTKKPASTSGNSGKGGPKTAAPSTAKTAAKPSSKATAPPPSGSGSRPPKAKTTTGGSGRSTAPGRRPIQPTKGRGPRRSPTSIFTWGVVALVLIIVAVLVVIKVTGSSTPGNTTPTAFVQTSAQIVDQATTIPTSVYDKVGVNSSLTQINQPIILKNQPTLVLAGKPGIFAFLGEFCPYCAAERWAVVTSLSRFGKFTNIGDMQSSSTDVFANTQTFTFTKATFQSPYVTFQPVERYSNVIDPSTGNWKIIAPFTAVQSQLVAKYDSTQYVGGSAGGIPFMDVGNKALFSGPSFTPAILANLSRSEIAANLDDPSNGVTQAILASSNYISATVCAIDGQLPTDVCSSKGVTEAAAALKLSS